MNFLPLKKYEIDTTGTNQDNRVMEERHLISPSYNVIIPVHAPFFQESLVVMYNGTRLTPNVDYQFDDLDVKATQASNKSVYTTIVLKRQDIQGEVWLNYQTYGDSNYAGVVAKYIELIMKDNRKVDWNEVFNKPAAYPPIYHKHHVKDIRGIWPIVVELQGIKQAIEYLRYKGNVKLKGEIFTHIAALNEKFDRFRSIVEQSINLEEMKREIINNLSAIIGTTVTNFVQSLDVQKLKDILIFFQGEGVSQISKDGVEHIFSFDGPNRPAGRDKIEEIKRVFESVNLTTTQFDSFLDTLDNRAYFTLYSRFRQFDREGYTKCFTQEIHFVIKQNEKELHVSATRFISTGQITEITDWEVAILRNDIEAAKEKETFKTEVVTQVATAAKADFTKELDKRLESLTINWNNVTNKPSFDTSWNAIADKPNFYPTRWDMISNLPDFTRYALKETLLSNNSLTSADYTKRVVSEHYIDTPVDVDKLFEYPLNINRIYRTINRADGLPALGTSTKVIPFGTTQKSHQHMVIDPSNNHIFFRGMGNSLVGLKVDWNDIENKPSKFSVNWNDIQGKPTDLVSGSVSWDNVQGKPDISKYPTKAALLGDGSIISSNYKSRVVNEILIEKPVAADKLFENSSNSNQVFKEVSHVGGFPKFGRYLLVMPIGTVQESSRHIIIDPEHKHIFFRNRENLFEGLRVDWSHIENKPANLGSSEASGPNTLVYKTPETVMRNGHPQHMITLSELFSDRIGEQRHFRMLATTNDRMTKTGVGFWLKDCFLPLTIGARVPELCHVRTTRLGNEVDWAYVMEVDAFTTIVDRQPGTTGQRAPQWYNANFVLYLRNPKQTFGSRYTDKGVEVTSRLTSTYAGGEFMIREVIHLFATTGSYGRTDRTYEEELLKTMELLTW